MVVSCNIFTVVKSFIFQYKSKSLKLAYSATNDDKLNVLFKCLKEKILSGFNVEERNFMLLINYVLLYLFIFVIMKH